MHMHIVNGVEGVIVGGTTEEGKLMGWDEHVMLIGHIVNCFGTSIKVTGNTRSSSTRELIHASEQGFVVCMHDAALRINPYHGNWEDVLPRTILTRYSLRTLHTVRADWLMHKTQRKKKKVLYILYSDPIYKSIIMDDMCEAPQPTIYKVFLLVSRFESVFSMAMGPSAQPSSQCAIKNWTRYSSSRYT